VNTGHDEYYSDGMRQNLTDGIAAGVNLALFSANNFYFRMTWDGDGSGRPLRRIHCDKWATPGSRTGEYRYLTPAQPENAIGGVMQNGVASSRPWLVGDASHWIFAGSGVKTYTGDGRTGVVTSGPNQNSLPGLVGYEFDSRAANAPLLSSFTPFEPPGLQQVGHSFVPASDNGGTDAWSDGVVYTAPSGAMVFSAGTIQWSFGVDNGVPTGFCDCEHAFASAASQRVTANILDRFTG